MLRDVHSRIGSRGGRERTLLSEMTLLATKGDTSGTDTRLVAEVTPGPGKESACERVRECQARISE